MFLLAEKGVTIEISSIWLVLGIIGLILLSTSIKKVIHLHDPDGCEDKQKKIKRVTSLFMFIFGGTILGGSAGWLEATGTSVAVPGASLLGLGLTLAISGVVAALCLCPNQKI